MVFCVHSNASLLQPWNRFQSLAALEEGMPTEGMSPVHPPCCAGVSIGLLNGSDRECLCTACGMA